MYKVFTELQGGCYVSIPLAEDGVLDLAVLEEVLEGCKPKMLILCSPNNPTGMSIPLAVLREVAEKFSGILVVDEAYAEFSPESMIPVVEEFSHLVVTRTFSKALGLAGVRLGYLVGQSGLVQEVSKVLNPYHLNSVSQMCGEVLLEHRFLLEERVELIVAERKRMQRELAGFPGWKVSPSEANFLFLQGPGVEQFAEELYRAHIRVRRFTDTLRDAIRITIGQLEENDAVLRVAKHLTRSKTG